MKTISKQFLIIMLLMVIVATINSNCKEEEEDVSPYELMQGNWKCIKTEYNNKTYYSCEEINSDTDVKDMYLMIFNIRIFREYLWGLPYRTDAWQIYDVCKDIQHNVVSIGYGAENEYGDRESHYLMLKVNKTTLILKRIYVEPTVWDEETSSYVLNNIPLNAVYTFERLPT